MKFDENQVEEKIIFGDFNTFWKCLMLMYCSIVQRVLTHSNISFSTNFQLHC